MAKRLISLNFNTNLEKYIQEESTSSLADNPIYSQSFIPLDSETQPVQFLTDYVKASVGGIFYGIISYPVNITAFSGQQIPTASWVENKISDALSSPPDFNALFNQLFSQKSISDLQGKSHDSLTNIQGDGSIHISSAQRMLLVTPASSTSNGYLTSTDWNTFNSKLSTTINTSNGLRYQNNTLSLVLNQIDHNSLANYNASEHVPKNDSLETSDNLWSAAKIKSYVSSQIPAQITDYVSKSNGGSFDDLVSYSTDKVISNQLNLVHKKYVDDMDTSLFNTIVSGLQDGVSSYSVKVILGELSLSDLGTKNHNSLTGIYGVSSEETPMHLNPTYYAKATTPASSLNDGYLTKEDWALFNSKLGSFSVALDTNQTDFLRYDSGIMYYNPHIIDHNSLANYSENNHPLLDDEQTTTTNVWSASKVQSMLTGSDFQSYRINLKSGATVAQRLVGLVEGQDYPTGWTLLADGTALVITHNLDKVCSVLSIFSVNGVTNDAVKLEGSVAYATLTNQYYNNGYNRIRIDALATITTDLIIKIIL